MKRGKIQPAVDGTRKLTAHRVDEGVPSLLFAETQLPRSVRIAREAQVMRKAQVHSKLHGMVASDFGPVVHELVLMFILNQRTVAARRIQAVPKVRQLRILIVPAVPLECR